MAYSAVTSLYQTIDHLVNSCRTSLTRSTKKILSSAQRGAKSLQRTLESNSRIINYSEEVMRVEDGIRDEARKLEDAIESQASAQFLSQSQSHGTVLSLNLDHLRRDIDCFLEKAEKMAAEYMEELNKPSPHEEAAAAIVPSTSEDDDYDMVGSSDEFLEIRDYIASDRTDLLRLAITGMAGIGKTAIARKLYHDSLVQEKFECRAFVRMGYKIQYKEILRAVLAQLNVDTIMVGDEDLDEYFKTSLRGRKFLIVLDDAWDSNYEYYFHALLPENCNGSCVLLTSRIQHTFGEIRSSGCQMPFLTEEQSWELLCRKVFGEGECPPRLVKAGKKIAENCEGLPLLIITIAQLLFKAPKEPEYWKEVAEMKNSVFEDACDQIYHVLISSYHHLPQDLKACFLYMAAFPKKYVVRHSRVFNLWCAERFVDGIWDAFWYLGSSNVVVVRQKDYFLRGVKACNLHIAYRHLCNRETEKRKFLHILNRYAEGSIEGIKDKRHLAIYHNTLLAIKEVNNSIASASTLRSVLCTGPYHQYQVPIIICLQLRLLRVLDALSIRFYEFPVEVVELIQLRYLSLTTNANLPPSINKLWFLQFLILHQHLSINRDIAKTYVPVEIWELQELEHLQIIGRNLPRPPPGAILPNLKRLLDVGVQTCAQQVLESTPKLEKLRIQIELAPDAAQTMTCFDHILCLNELRSLASVVKNPKLLPKPSPPRLLLFPIDGLTKLSLSGFGYPWEDMSTIAELPHLSVLKLRSYAFRGEKWAAKDMRFRLLGYLMIEDTDLVQWTAEDETFKWLERLTMKNCHKLKEIPQVKTLCQIELVDCNPLAETSAKRNAKCVVEVEQSWK